MAEVVVQNGAKLSTLADKINAEHRACVTAQRSAAAHAIEAGRLLEEAKAALPHTAWGPWLVANFEGSDRTDRVYRQLYREQEKLKQNGSTAATLSLRQALKALAEPKPPPRPLWVPEAPEGAQPDPQVLEGLETEEEIAQAWQRHNQEALAEQRAAERAVELRDIIEVLDQLVPKYPPEEAGKELARVTGQNRGLTVLRDSISWLQQTLEVAEQAQERILARE
jgi:hypothetical protein